MSRHQYASENKFLCWTLLRGWRLQGEPTQLADETSRITNSRACSILFPLGRGVLFIEAEQQKMKDADSFTASLWRPLSMLVASILEDRFYITQEVALLNLSLFVLGLGLGPLILPPRFQQLRIYLTLSFY